MQKKDLNSILRFPTIALLFVLTQFSTSVYLPIMPYLTTVFQTDDAAVMRTLVYAVSGYALGQLCWGGLSDKLGRKKLMIGALIGYSTLSFWMPTLTTIKHFSIAFFALGTLYAAPTSIGHAMIRDLYGRNGAKKPIATLGILMAAGPFVGPLIGAYLFSHFGWSSIFNFFGLYALITALGILTIIPETQYQHATEVSNEKIWPLYLGRFSNHRFSAYVVILGLGYASMYLLLQQAPFIFIKTLGYTTIQFSWMFSMVSACNVIGALINRYYIETLGPDKLIKIGILCSLIAGAGLTMTLYYAHGNFLGLMISCSLLMLGVGFTTPASKAGAMTTFKKHPGTSASVMKFTQLFFATVFSLMGAHMADANHGDELALIVLTAACLSAGFSQLLYRPLHKK